MRSSFGLNEGGPGAPTKVGNSIVRGVELRDQRSRPLQSKLRTSDIRAGELRARSPTPSFAHLVTSVCEGQDLRGQSPGPLTSELGTSAYVARCLRSQRFGPSRSELQNSDVRAQDLRARRSIPLMVGVPTFVHLARRALLECETTGGLNSGCRPSGPVTDKESRSDYESELD